MKKRNDRILVIDIGNRFIKIYIVVGDELAGRWIFGRERANWDFKLAKIAGRSGCASGVIVSVVPADTKKAISSFKQAGVEYLVVGGEMALPISLNYASPKYLGADRIADAVGAVEFWGERSSQIIIVDVGTAITVDLVRGKEFLGGVIMPGIDMMKDALHQKAAQLPQTKKEVALNFPGRGTEQCIVAGSISASVGGIMFAREKFLKNPDDALLLLTGGDCEKVSKFLELPHELDPLLLVRGAIAIYDFTVKNGAKR